MIIEIFKQITKIPRCSGTYKPFIKFLQTYSKQFNYECIVDNTNNILCYKKDTKSKICLQSHYDIVCLEDDKIPEIYEEDGYLKAKDSTLGADNGIGCAYMLALMSENKNCEFLFTSDEEIGLIGANSIEFNLNSKYMLNLDSETLGEICIGCAGGIDIFGTNKNSNIIKNSDNKKLYEIQIDNLDGGHSGVDIDKDIPNAIKLLAKTIKECNGDLIEINGGERINSIPKKATAIIATTTMPKISHKNMEIKLINTPSEHYKKLDDKIIDFIYSFSNGVRGFDKELDTVSTSINLAIIKTTIDSVKIELSARSMNNEQLQIIKDETTVLLNLCNFDIKFDGKYPSWEPNANHFTTKVLQIYKKYYKEASLEAIHAGLECAILKDIYPNMQICSIGPNIYFPHSNNEKCEISSVYKIYTILQEIIKEYN